MKPKSDGPTQVEAANAKNLKVAGRLIRELKPSPVNPRLHTKKQVRQIAASIKNFGFNPRTLVGQLIVDAAVDASKLFYVAGSLSVSAVAQVVGRVVGLGAGIALLMSSQRRAAAAPRGAAREVCARAVSTDW